MLQLFRSLASAICVVVLVGLPAWAQSPAPTRATETQEQLTATVQHLSDRIADLERQLDVPRASQALLAQLDAKVQPLLSETQAVVDRLTPRVAAMKARLDQIGTKPEKGETADVAKERESLEKSFADNDGLFKHAKVLVLKAQQAANYIGKRERTLFTTSLFQRSTSILSPPLWLAVAQETPGNLADIATAFHQWLDQLNAGLSGGKLIGFWTAVILVILLYWPLTWAARRFLRRSDSGAQPTRWRKLVAAGWTCLTVAGSMIAVMYAAAYLFTLIVPSDPRFAPVYGSLQSGIVRIALAAGIGRGLLAPSHAKWRLVNVDDSTAGKLMRIVLVVALIVSLGHVLEALNDLINASYAFSVAVRGVATLLVAACLTAALVDLGDSPEAENPEDASGGSAASVIEQRSTVWGLVRAFAWALIVIIAAAVAIGYVAFGSFIVEQLTLIVAVGAALFLLVSLLDEASAAGLRPDTRLGQRLIYTVGLRRETLEQLPVLISGGGRLLLFGIALFVVAAPWGMQSNDLAGNVGAIFFGFKIGDFTVSIEGIVIALVSFILVLAATRAIQNWLEDRYLPTTRLDSGLRNSIKTSLGYIGFIVALALAAGNLGLDFQKLAIVAGALSVGIGFGLQSVVNNFVSGLILLWERAVRVGDWVVVGADQGYVRKINVRSTEIETFDRALVIVPNSNLVSGVVKNLMRSDRIGRLTIELTVHAVADPEKVREVLLEICSENESVLSLPAPQVRFINLTASSMSFDLFCYVADVEASARTKSDLYFEICKQFREYHFFDGPAPDPTVINLLGLDRLQEALRQREAVVLDTRRDVDADRPRRAV